MKPSIREDAAFVSHVSDFDANVSFLHSKGARFVVQ
jgi:hypothetical protein